MMAVLRVLPSFAPLSGILTLRRVVCAVAFAVVILLIWWKSWCVCPTTVAMEGSRLVNPTLRKPRMSDGCYHVYLDTGANVGVQVRKLFEPSQFPYKRVPGRITSQIEVYEAQFGTNHSQWREQVCVFMFEPNPLHQARLRAIADCYSSRGWRTTLFNVAASNSDNESLHFLIQNVDAGNHYWAAQVISDTDSADRTKNLVVSVKSMDITRFIMDDVAQRIIPPSIGNMKPPSVTMKLDIEGSETSVLPNMLVKGAFCVVDSVIPELHPQFVEGDARAFLKQIVPFVELLRSVNKTSGCAIPSLKHVDDESYHRDIGIPEGCQSHFINLEEQTQELLKAAKLSKGS